MTGRAFDRQPVSVDLDTDVIAEGFGDLVAELRGYADQVPAHSDALASRVLAALRTEAATGHRPAIAPDRTPLFARIGLAFRPRQFRTVLAAAALTLALGAGAVFAANGGRLPFDLPTFGAPADDQGQPPSQVLPGGEDVDADEDQDEDVDQSPQSSDDVDVDEDQDEDADEDTEGDEDQDADEDDDSNGDQDADEDDDSNGDQDSDEDDDSNSGDNSDDDSGSNDDGDDTDQGGQGGSGDQDQSAGQGPTNDDDQQS
jgi:hypothetical protein